MKRALIVLGCLLALSGCAGYPYSVEVGVGGGYNGDGYRHHRYNEPYYREPYYGCYPVQVPIYNRFGQPIGYRTICR